MNSLKDIDKDLKINRCSYLKSIQIIDTDKGSFVVKKKKHDNRDLFRYLDSKNFHNFLNLYNDNRYYEIYPYIDNVNVTDSEKALDIIYLISMLHNKTTFYKPLEIDKIKQIYEDINDKLTYITNYYDNIRFMIEDENYMSPSGYLLLRNISLIYQSIDMSRYFINQWYNTIKNKKNIRIATIHNYLELDHLIRDDDVYLISWDKSCKASPIYDLFSLYQNVYDKVDFSPLFDLYNSKYPLQEEEHYLLFALLLVPQKLDLSNREIINTKEVYNLTTYLQDVINFVSKHYSKTTNS